MIFWAIVTGALIGLSCSGWSGTGLVAGAVIGAAMGAWLQSGMRKEIAKGVARALEVQISASPAYRTQQATNPEAFPGKAAAGALPTPDADTLARIPVVEPGLTPFQTQSLAAAASPRQDAPATRQNQQPEAPPVHQAYVSGGQAFADEWINKARAWLLGGNTIVRAGLVILFVGLTFLARMVAQRGLFPIEARLALVALAGTALLALGFNRRVQRPAFGLSLQGTGVAVLYLTVFASARIFGLMPPLGAFGLMMVFAALGCTLALLQDARGMAFASFLGGYAVPILLGGHARTPAGLFTYLTILNLALLVIAWRKSWRELNLLGFFATFGMATLWGFASYGPQSYLLCQIFLALSVAIFLFAAVFYAHNTPGPLGNAADTTLLFGPAMAGFALQVGLVHDRPFGTAFAALAFAAFYLAVAAYTLRQRRDDMRLLRECLLAIGLGFVTLAVPLALDARWTSSAWALEGAGAFWVGARQARWMPRAFGLTLQAVAALVLFSTLSANVSAVPFANNGFLGASLVAIPLLLTAWWMRRELPHSGSNWATLYAGGEFAIRQTVFLAGCAMVAIAICEEVTRELPAATARDFPQAVFDPWQQALLAMLALLVVAGIADWFGRRRNWNVATWPARGSLPLIALAFLSTLIMDRHVLFRPDAAAWVLALVGHYALLRRSDIGEHGNGSDGLAKWNAAVHAGGAWLLTAMVADSLYFAVDGAKLWNTSWSGAVFLISVTAILATLTRWAGRAAPLSDTRALRWPLHPGARAYWWVAAVPLAALTYFGALIATLFAEGITNPLPYFPLINPVDLSVALALATLALWRRMVVGAHQVPALAQQLWGKPALVAGGTLAFVAINGVWMRTAHHWLGVDWNAGALRESPVVEAGFSILWTLIAMALMLFAHRRALRISWAVGAGLLAVVVAKLLLSDMSTAEGWERIVTFIGVGVLMLVIGYFVPLPPKDAGGAKSA